MIFTEPESWLQRLRAGAMDVSDLELLEQLNMETALTQLLPLFPHKFLDHRIRDKHEVGLAAKFRRRGPAKSFQHCILLTSQSQSLTTFAKMTALRIRPSKKKSGNMELSCGAGFNLYRDPDGWRIKLLEESTISLSPESLQSRGWIVSTPDKAGAA